MAKPLVEVEAWSIEELIAAVMTALKTDGSLRNVGNRLASFDERQRAVDKDKFDKLEQLYRTGGFKVS